MKANLVEVKSRLTASGDVVRRITLDVFGADLQELDGMMEQPLSVQLEVVQ